MSEHDCATWVQGGHVKHDVMGFSQGKMDVHFKCLCDYGITCAVDETEFDRRYGIRSEMMSLYDMRVDERVRGPGVHQRRQDEVFGRLGGDRNHEGVRARGGGGVKPNCCLCTKLSDAALNWCVVWRAAHSFFASMSDVITESSSVAAARAFAAEELVLGQSLAMCPGLAQNRHRLLSRWC